MREAIQGMLSMSRGGLSSMQLFSKTGKHGLKKSSLAIEDEEEQLSKCYQDDEFGKLTSVTNDKMADNKLTLSLPKKTVKIF